MKKYFVFLIFMLATLPLFAQTVDPGSGVNVAQYFVNLSVFAPVIVIITQFVLRYVKTDLDQIVSWIVAFLLSGVGWLLNFGMFAEVAWYWIFIYGLAAGLVANGIFDIPIVQAILSIIPKKKAQK